mgnify:CR=1 FL=1
MCAVAFAERRRRLSSRSLSALAWACELFCGCVDDENLACFRSYIFVLRLVLWPSRTKLGYRNSWCQKKSCSRCLANTERTRDPCRDAHRTIPAGLLMSLHDTIAMFRKLVLRSWRHACGGSTCHEVLCRLQPCTLMLCAYSSVCRYRAAARCLGTWLATAISWGCTDDDACLLWLHSSQCSDSSDAMVTNATSDGTGVSRLNHSAS